MKPLTCSAVRRRLQAFHDGELRIGDQIAVGAHLDGCVVCADTLDDLQSVAAGIKLCAPGRDGLSRDEAVALTSRVISRRKAEEDAAFIARVRRVFDDIRLVYAGGGAAVATIVCVTIMLGMMRFATAERPDSLAAIVDLMATPGSTPSTIAIDAASHQRGTARFQAAYESAEEDAVFTLAALVTRQGRLSNLDRLRAAGGRAGSDQAKLVKGLMDAVTRARFEPGSVSSPTPTSGMVWLVTKTTVRANKIGGMDLVLPPAKKRITRFGAYRWDGRLT